jgi:hypothetical protein
VGFDAYGIVLQGADGGECFPVKVGLPLHEVEPFIGRAGYGVEHGAADGGGGGGFQPGGCGHGRSPSSAFGQMMEGGVARKPMVSSVACSATIWMVARATI